MDRMSPTQARQAIAARGPRFAVSGAVRRDDILVGFYDTAELAEAAMARLAETARHVKLHLPSDVDPEALRRRLTHARAELVEATAIASAGAKRLVEAGLSEVKTAEMLGVDRQTIRSWLGK